MLNCSDVEPAAVLQISTMKPSLPVVKGLLNCIKLRVSKVMGATSRETA